MSAYEERLETAADHLESFQNCEDGGWGGSLGEGSSAVNTAEALAILRAAQRPYDYPPVARGVAFLRAAITEHPRARTDGGRGEWTRYVTYSLFGLAEFADWRQDDESRAAVVRGFKWLRDRTTDGGWGARAGDSQVSLFHTAQVIRALARVGVGDRDLASSARLALMELRLDGRHPTWPNRVAGREPAVAKTALAALALAIGDEEQRQVARAAAEWLAEHRSAWQHSVDLDPDMEGVRWTHMVFALGAQACLANGISPLDVRLKPSAVHLDKLWDRKRCLWRQGSDPRSSPAGVIPSAAVVQTYEAFQAALGRTDPTQIYSTRSGSGDHVEFTLILVSAESVSIRVEGEQPQPISLGKRSRLIIDCLLENAVRGNSAALSRTALEAAYGRDGETVGRAVRRINAAVRENSSVEELIEVRPDSFVLTTRRWEYASHPERPIVESGTDSQSNMNTNHQGELTYYTFDRLSALDEVTHGVFSRHGGTSDGAFTSLNASAAVGDHPGNVRKNVARIADALGFRSEDVFKPRLVHGEAVHQLGAGALPADQQVEADAVITDRRGVLLSMTPADCAVILLYDPEASAIGMVHAGWKGIVAGIPDKTVAAMSEAFGSSPEHLIAAIGPSVGPCHYRIENPAQKSMPEWAPYLEDLEDGRTALDLPGMLIDQLLEAGIDGTNLEVDRRCTACNVETFFSYWIDKPTTGRMAVTLGLKHPG